MLRHAAIAVCDDRRVLSTLRTCASTIELDMPPLDPLSLRLFLSVIDAGTIAAAAQREHIAAAAVSRRISEIEAMFGVALLRRTNKGVAPTEAGDASDRGERQSRRQMRRHRD